MRNNIKIFLTLTFLNLSCLLGNPNDKYIYIDKLPEYFYPLKWDLNTEELKKYFQAKELEVYHGLKIKHNEKIYTNDSIGFSNIDWKHIGLSSVGLYFAENKYVNQIIINLIENRPECDIYTHTKTPEYCRYNYSDELVEIVARIKEEIEKTLGKPKKIYFNDKQLAYEWNTNTYSIYLRLINDEEDNTWDLHVIAMRKNIISN